MHPTRGRRLTLALPAIVVCGLATALVQALRAGYRRDLPTFEGYDPSGDFGSPDDPLVRIVALGDSALTGPGLTDPDDIWIRQVCRALATHHRIELRCLATGGTRAADVLAHQLEAAEALRPDISFVAVGTNDVTHRTPPRLFAAQLSEIVERLATCSRAVILPGMGDLGTVPRAPFPLSSLLTSWSALINAIQERAAARHDNVWMIPMRRLTTAAFRRDEVFSPDRYHPNVAGHTVWAEAAIPGFRQVVDSIGDRAPAR
ncbi:MAG TPA: SGNH/GDSL hydrolase family protein [Acidimicrobiia bacterium]|nr:SGNH/GDSL hydrolase family protein [Acidimicrobiia bacterium]